MALLVFCRSSVVGGGGETEPDPTLWVNGTTGDDSRSKATVAASGGSLPWQTIGRAAWGSTTRSAPNASEAAAAGDVVLVAAGTYSGAGTSSGTDPLYNPANNGTSGSPIIFRGYLDEPLVEGTNANSVILQQTGSGSVIGANGKDYIIWEGFYIDEATAVPVPDKGVAVCFDTTGSQIRNCEIKGSYIEWPGDLDDNHNGIRFEQVVSGRIANNRVYEIGSMEEPDPDIADRGQNDAAVMFYDVFNTVVENNLFYECGVGIFAKGEHPGDPVQGSNTYRYNRIHTMDHSGIRLLDTQNDLCYQNIISGVRDVLGEGGGITGAIWLGFGAIGPDLAIVNNTFYDCFVGIHFQQTGSHEATITIKNNIALDCDYVWASGSQPADPTSAHEFDRNNGFGFGANQWYSGPAGDLSLASFRTTFTEDMNSITTDPNLVDPANENFTPQAAATLSLGRVVFSIGGTNDDIIPAGAIITGDEVIGLDI